MLSELDESQRKKGNTEKIILVVRSMFEGARTRVRRALVAQRDFK